MDNDGRNVGGAVGSRGVRGVGRNAAWLALGRVASQALALVLTIVVARGLGTAGFGQYAFVGAVVLIGSVVTTFGTDLLLIREIAGGGADIGRRLTTALTLQLLLSAAFVVLVAAGASWLPGRTAGTVSALRIYALSLFPLAFSSVFSAALRAWERMDLYASLGVGTAALQTGAALAAVRARVELPQLMFWLLLAQVVAAVSGWLLCRAARPGVALAARVAPAALVSMLKRAWPLALLAGLGILGQRIGVVLLSLLAGDAQAGWFAAAARIVEGLKLAHYAVLGALFPVASRVIAQTASDRAAPVRHRVTDLLRRSWLVLLVWAVAAAVGACTLARPLVALLYGHAYGPAVRALRILSWTLLPYAAGAPASVGLIAAGHERAVLRAMGLAVVVTAAWGVWLIPAAGDDGACVAVLAGEVVCSALLLFAVGRAAGTGWTVG